MGSEARVRRIEGRFFWLQPAMTQLRRKTKEEWTDKHRNVARKLVLEGGRVPRRKGQMTASVKLVTNGKVQTPPLPRMVRSFTGDPKGSEKREPTHAIGKKVLCVRFWKGTCFCRRVLLSSLPFPSHPFPSLPFHNFHVSCCHRSQQS